MKTSDKPKSNTTEKPKSPQKPKGATEPDKGKPAPASGKAKPAAVADKPAPPAKFASAKQARDALIASAREKQAAAPDPAALLDPKKLAIRIGIPLAIFWVVMILLPGWGFEVAAVVVTLAVGALVVWVLRQTKRSQAVANLMRTADTPEARKEAIEKLETEFGKDDATAMIARAQLEMQEDPKKALATLEAIKLEKTLPPVADQARGLRALIHLMLGETEAAKGLVDKIDLGRHKDAKTRASLAATIGEAWARGGAAKKAVELLETLDPNDQEFADIKPQLLRSCAFAYAWTNDTKKMKQTLRSLSAMNPQYLAFFITKKKIPGGVSPKGVHPLLEKEAYEMITRSGMVPRKMEYRRS